MTRLLIIEDDKDLRDTMSNYLQLKGNQVRSVGTLTAAEALLENGQIDLVLLDLNLPDGDGLTLLRRLREGSRLPVFVVSGRSDERSRLSALELSADDYIIKPVNLRELTLKIGNFLARFQPRSAAVYSLGRWLFYPAGHYLHLPRPEEESAATDVIRLTGSESCCLRCLCEASGHLVTTAEMIAALQQANVPMSRESLPVVISRLRSKLQPVQDQGSLIESVPRAGYRLTPGGLQRAPHAAN